MPRKKNLFLKNTLLSIGSDRKSLLLICMLIFFLANFLIAQVNLRIDLSKGKVYTLSKATREVMKELDDVVNIKFVASSNIPRQLYPLKDRVLGMLEEYKKLNPNFKVQVLDPDKDEDARKFVEAQGLPELRFSEQKEGKLSLSKAYFGIVMQYLDKTEVIPQVVNIESLEYDLTTSVYRLIQKELPEIAIIGKSQPFLDQQSDISVLDRTLRNQFGIVYPEIDEIDSKKNNLVLLIDDGQRSYSTEEADILRRYVQQKGNMIVFVDGVWVSDNLTTQAANHNLNSFLKDFGMRVKDNLILSASSELVNFGGGEFNVILPYPFWVKTDNFDTSKPFFSNIRVLVFPWVSEIVIEGEDVEPLVKTRPESWEQAGNFQLLPDSITLPQKDQMKEYVISALYQGKDKGKLAVVASRRFFLDRFLSQNDNLNFIANLALSFANPKLAGISVKEAGFYILPTVPYPLSEIIKYGLILFLPSLFLLIGIIKIVRQR